MISEHMHAHACMHVVAGEPLSYGTSGWITNTGSFCVFSALSLGMVSLDSDGRLARLMRKWISPKYCPAVVAESDGQLSVADMAGIFMLSIVGVVLSLVIKFWHDILVSLHLKDQKKKALPEQQNTDGQGGADQEVEVVSLSTV